MDFRGFWEYERGTTCAEIGPTEISTNPGVDRLGAGPFAGHQYATLYFLRYMPGKFVLISTLPVRLQCSVCEGNLYHGCHRLRTPRDQTRLTDRDRDIGRPNEGEFHVFLQTSLEIAASPESVWGALVDLDRYDERNPMINNIQAEPLVGSPVAFEVVLSAAKRMKFKAKMAQVDEPIELNWKGGSLFLVTGRHYFRIEKLGDNSVRLHHGEDFKGLLLPLLAKRLKKGKPLYTAMNEALKKRVEN